MFAMALSPAAAQEYRDRNSAGGSGGAPFTARCAQGDYLVGLSARSGNLVDAIAPLCARWDAAAGAFLPPGEGALQGGRGGAPAQARCDNGSAVNFLLVETDEANRSIVSMIAPRCANALNPAERTPHAGATHFGRSLTERLAAEAEAEGYGSSAVPYYSEARMPQCRADYVAVGLFGRAGAYLDRIGLICAPRPQTRTQQMASQPSQAARGRLGQTATQAPSCRSGFVWREASTNDFVCAPPAARDRVAAENAAAPGRTAAGGACRSGFVWREALSGDVACVTPEARAQARSENAAAPARTQR